MAIIRKRTVEIMKGFGEPLGKSLSLSLSAYAWNAEQRTGLINATAPFLLFFPNSLPNSIRFSLRRSGAFANRGVVLVRATLRKNYRSLSSQAGTNLLE